MPNWGGKREGAGSGGPRPGSGRPRTRWNTGGRGTVWKMERSERPGALPDKPRRWVILSVSDDEIEFQDLDTEELYIITRPDDN
jgi:hypothetical protein